MDDKPTRKHEPSERRRPRRLKEAGTAEIGFPLVWIVIGGLAGLIVIGLVGLGVVNLVRQGAITPTPQVLPPLIEPVASLPAATATTAPQQTGTVAATPPATPAQAEATSPAPPAPAAEITVDGFVRVAGTEGVGLSLRAGPGRNNARLGLAEEDETVVLQVLDGPHEDENAEDYVWWFVRHPDGTEGWVVQDFLLPVEGP